MGLKLFGGLGPITRASALRDIWAGLSLAALNIPEVLGYTRIAGTPVVTGLYTVLLPLLAFTVFGSSRHLMVAADSATAAILYGSLSHMATPASVAYMQLVGMLALLTAGLLLMARIFRLGFFADFLSRTVLVGFLAGVGLQVGIAMLGDMAGDAVVATSTLGRLWEVLRTQPHLPTLGRHRRQCGVRLCQPRHRGDRPDPRRASQPVLAAGELEPDHRPAAGGRLLRGDDPGPECGDVSRFRRALR